MQNHSFLVDFREILSDEMNWKSEIPHTIIILHMEMHMIHNWDFS